MSVVLVFIIELISVFINHQFKIEKCKSYFTSCMILMLFLYIFGLFNILNIGFYTICVLSILLFGYCFIIKKMYKNFNKIDYLFCFSGIVLWLLLQGTHFFEWDEFSHWGPNIKAMFYRNTLWANKVWDGNHISYPPIIAIFEYLSCKLNGIYTEPSAFFGLDILIMTIILYPINHFKNKTQTIGYFICFYMLINIMGFRIASLYIDLILGLVFFISLFLVMNIEDENNKLTLYLSLFILPLVKDTGLICSFYILFFYFIRFFLLIVICKKRIDKKQIYIFLNMFIIICLSFLSWKLYCSFNGVHNDFRHDANMISYLTLHDIKEYIKTIIFRTSLEKNITIYSSFLTALTNYPIIKNVSTVLLFSILNIIMIYNYKLIKKNKKNDYISFQVLFIFTCISYLLFLVFSYIYVLPDHEGRLLICIERYLNPILLPFVLIVVFSLIKHIKNKKIWMIILILLSFCNLNSLLNPFYNKSDLIADHIKYKASIINDNCTINDKIYVIYQNTTGLEFNQIRYLISPIRTELLWEWSLGEKYSEYDYFTYSITSDEFKNKLIDEKYDYIFFANVDEQFIDKYKEVIKIDSIDKLQDKLFKISIENDEITLEKVND